MDRPNDRPTEDNMPSALATTSHSGSPYKLDPDQTLRAATALLAKIKADAVIKKTSSSGKPSLLDDADDTSDADESETTPVWLTLTTKKHITDKRRLKPGKIQLPHPLYSTSTTPPLRICLITADPQRTYKDLVANPAFPSDVASTVARVLGVTKLKAKYHSYESKRQLAGEYDLFLADDRIVTLLPTLLGKTFYSQGNKRPVPVCLQGRRDQDPNSTGKRVPLAKGGPRVTRQQITPQALAHEISRAMSSALVHLSPSTSTAIRVGTSGMTPSQVHENITAVVEDAVERYVPQKWRNVRAIHVKGPQTAALPIWLASELWVDEGDVLEEIPQKTEKLGTTKGVAGDKINAIKAGAEAESKSEVSRGGKKRKAASVEKSGPDASTSARKDLLKRQKLEAAAL